MSVCNECHGDICGCTCEQDKVIAEQAEQIEQVKQLLCKHYGGLPDNDMYRGVDQLINEVILQAEQITNGNDNAHELEQCKTELEGIVAEQAEQIARLTNALGAITYINPSERCAENKMIEIAKEALEHIDGIGNVIVWKGNSDE